MSASIHKKLSRVRKPRVHITYDVETGGAEVARELPFVVGVMGDFSGDPTAPLKPLAERKFTQIDRDNFDKVMASMTPGLNLKVENTLLQTRGFRSGKDCRTGTGAEGAHGKPQQAARPAEQGRSVRGAGRPVGKDSPKRRGYAENLVRARRYQEGGLSHVRRQDRNPGRSGRHDGT